MADGSGAAWIAHPVPGSARGRTFLIHAAPPAGCKVSQLVVHRFE